LIDRKGLDVSVNAVDPGPSTPRRVYDKFGFTVDAIPICSIEDEAESSSAPATRVMIDMMVDRMFGKLPGDRPIEPSSQKSAVNGNSDAHDETIDKTKHEDGGMMDANGDVIMLDANDLETSINSSGQPQLGSHDPPIEDEKPPTPKRRKSEIQEFLPLPSKAEYTTDLVFVCRGPRNPGKFNVKKADALGVPKTKRGVLVQGESVEVENSDGSKRVVLPEECLEGASPGSVRRELHLLTYRS
jgi:hypothetical protein